MTIYGPAGRDRLGLPPEQFEAVKAQFVFHVPLARMGTVEDIAHAMTFVASDHAAYIPGAELAVDGGHAQVRPGFARDAPPGTPPARRADLPKPRRSMDSRAVHDLSQSAIDLCQSLVWALIALGVEPMTLLKAAANADGLL